MEGKKCAREDNLEFSLGEGELEVCARHARGDAAGKVGHEPLQLSREAELDTDKDKSSVTRCCLEP